MIRGGYVGRNPCTGDLQKHLQNGYERIQKGISMLLNLKV
jgi:hypothetical protein